MNDDEQHYQAFGGHTGIDEEVREDITRIKNNDPDTIDLTIRRYDAREVTDMAWRLLGRYIANNIHLLEISLDECNLTDEQIISLFSGLTSSTSLRYLDIDDNDFGIDGVRSIIPLLQNCPHLTTLFMSANTNIDTECFELVLSALDGKSMEELFISSCNITDISALDRYNLPHLKQLNLNWNKIGREGCIILSNLLQQEGSTLTTLYLRDTGMGDQEADIIAASLKHNTKLKELYLSENNLTNETYVVFLKLLVDITSIDTVYSSNHTLTTCELNEYDGDNTQAEALNDACKENKLSSNPEAAGRAKVIKYQLDSQERKKLYELQGIEYSSIGNLLADIDPNLLPQTLALIGREHGHSEFYTSLLPVAPDLMSFINREAILEEERAKNSSRAAILRQQADALIRQASIISAKNDQIDERLALIKLGDVKQMTVVDGGKECGGGEKRQRMV